MSDQHQVLNQALTLNRLGGSVRWHNQDTPFTTLELFLGYMGQTPASPLWEDVGHNDRGLAKSVNQAYAVVVITPSAQEVT